MQLLLLVLWLALACGSVHTTLSKSDAKKAALKTLSEKTQLSDRPVQDRGLVVTDPKAEDVVLEHRSYCAAKARERHFAGDVLGYVTPWNSHGYEIAKVFGNKFTLISPVWLQLKRRGREMFEVTGLHDMDQGWMRAIRKHAKGLRIVPRLLFEDWTYDDFRNVLDSEDEVEELSKTVVQVAKVRPGASQPLSTAPRPHLLLGPASKAPPPQAPPSHSISHPRPRLHRPLPSPAQSPPHHLPSLAPPLLPGPVSPPWLGFPQGTSGSLPGFLLKHVA
uniref:Chitinase domain containing 1 n=1 Tax=Oryctolagus cuniculus TaxID=9986 RepID=G1TJY2_RABIT